MRNVNIYSGFNFGTGTGENDLRVIGLAQEEVIGEIDISSMIGSGELISNIAEEGDHEHQLNFVAVPGYFYVGDLECYCYNSKVTQISTPIISSGTVSDVYPSGTAYIPLQEIPDGLTVFVNYPKISNNIEISKNSGAAPINVHIFSSGELSSRYAVFEKPIYSQTGVGGTIGYTYALSGEVVTSAIEPGEAPTWPAEVTPLSRVSVFPSYWNRNSSIDQNTYQYDPEYNRIVFEDGAVLASNEVLIEFEGANEPFIIRNIDMNPTITYPDNYIMCLSPESDSFKEIPASINLHSTREMMGSMDFADLAFEVLSDRGNRLPDVGVNVEITRKNMTLSGYPCSGFPFTYYDVCHSRDDISAQYDIIYLSGDLCNGGIPISERDGIRVVPSAGFLTLLSLPEYIWQITDVYGTMLTTFTGEHGIGRVTYISPSYVPCPEDITVRVTVSGYPEVYHETDISLIPEYGPSYYLASGSTYDMIAVASGEVSGGCTFVTVSGEILSLMDTGICSVGEYVSSIYENRDTVYSYPSDTDVVTSYQEWKPDHIPEDIKMNVRLASHILLSYTSEHTGKFMMKKKQAINYARGDMRQYYA